MTIYMFISNLGASFLLKFLPEIGVGLLDFFFHLFFISWRLINSHHFSGFCHALT